MTPDEITSYLTLFVPKSFFFKENDREKSKNIVNMARDSYRKSSALSIRSTLLKKGSSEISSNRFHNDSVDFIIKFDNKVNFENTNTLPESIQNRLDQIRESKTPRGEDISLGKDRDSDFFIKTNEMIDNHTVITEILYHSMKNINMHNLIPAGVGIIILFLILYGVVK